MRFKLGLSRSNGTARDIVITADPAATVGDVAQTLARREAVAGNPGAALTLAVQYPGETGARPVAPEVALGDAPIASGATVSITTERQDPSAGRGRVLAILRVIQGPDAGREFQLYAGTAVIGRDAGADIVLADPLVSKRHARVDVTQTVDLVDLNSANGIVVDGVDVTRVSLESGQTALVGDTVLRAEIVQRADGSPGVEVRSGTVVYNRPPLVEPRYAGQVYEAPEVPKAIEPIPIPWVALVAPLVMGVAVVFIPGAGSGPSRFLFLALSPILLIGGVLSQRVAKKRKHQQSIESFDTQLERLSTTLDAEEPREREVRLLEAPSTESLIATAKTLGPGMWARRPEQWSFLNVRLGTGTARSRNTVDVGKSADGLPEFLERLDAVVDKHVSIAGVPIVENVIESGAIGVAGAEEDAGEAANSLLVQLAASYSPAEVAFSAIVSPAWSRRLDWLKWLPHTGSPQSPLAGPHLADNEAAGGILLAALEEIIAGRLAARNEMEPRGPQAPDRAVMQWGTRVGEDRASDGAPVPCLVVVISDDAPVDRARLIRLTERAIDAGVIPVWIGRSTDSLPAACRTHLTVAPAGTPSRVGFVRLGTVISDVEVSRTAASVALDFARGLAGVVDAGALEVDDSNMPRSVSFVSLLGPELARSSAAVIERWQENDSIADRRPGAVPRKRRAGKLRAIVGQTAMDAMHLDLRTNGPHALVGGTTGSGKSEFLQSWVLGMAAEYSPDRVTFLFVDYKGGSAFAECVQLPHCVGLVTDLSPHLVRRALTSLRAELHYRERLFNAKKAKDLLELEKRGDPDAPPALVLVFDEFAALVGDVPEFVDGVVDIAQRGRSLGIHLIMATQRPAGVIRDNLRANTNLRIALRMADEADSLDVVGDKVAGLFDPSIPGRAIAKTGPGRLTTFQAGYAGGWTSETQAAPAIDIADLRFGADQPWEAAVAEAELPVPAEQGPTDQVRLVQSLIAAARVHGIPAPRRPWLDELAPVFDLALLRQRSDAELVLGVTDVPEHQRQDQTYFRPDTDGNLAILGASGSGKSVVLRTLAAAAGITPRGGPVDVYGLDFGTGALKMLETLPHVGSVVSGDDPERVVRLLRLIRTALEDRTTRYTAVNAGSIGDYRAIAGRPDEPRILLLVDNFPQFRTEFETGSGRAPWYGVFQQILSDGRGLGIHVALTADRPGSIPTAISSTVQRRVVLRLADEAGYVLLDEPSDVLSPSSPPGRALVDGLETQIAILGGSQSVADQSKAMDALAGAISGTGRKPTAPIGALPTEYAMADLPATVGGLPSLAISDESLETIGFEPSGTFVLAGPPASGRSTALETITASIRRAIPGVKTYYFGPARSTLGSADGWTGTARSLDDVVTLARELATTVADETSTTRIVVVIEQIADYLSSPADAPLVELIKAIKRSDHLVIAESESGQWGSSWPLLSEMKSPRTGLLLQPEGIEGETILKTPLPRGSRTEFPPGRGYFIARGKATRVQLPLVEFEEG